MDIVSIRFSSLQGRFGPCVKCPSFVILRRMQGTSCVLALCLYLSIRPIMFLRLTAKWISSWSSSFKNLLDINLHCLFATH